MAAKCRKFSGVHNDAVYGADGSGYQSSCRGRSLRYQIGSTRADTKESRANPVHSCSSGRAEESLSRMLLPSTSCQLRLWGRPRPRRERPRGRRATDKRHELASPHHSITSSARARSVGGIVTPIMEATFRLMISSSLVGNSTGRSPGAGGKSSRLRPNRSGKKKKAAGGASFWICLLSCTSC